VLKVREEYLKYLACPACAGDVFLIEVLEQSGGSIATAKPKCSRCSETYDIVKHIPRFVSSNNYALGFGFQWTKHSKIQFDSYNGTHLSEERFFRQTKWPKNLKGETILEVGSGAGRFTEQAASTGAMIVALDYSNAVDANYSNNGGKDNVLIVQGDMYRMPFRKGWFDKVFCFGVLQHTPSPEKAFSNLPCYLKPDGKLAIDVYLRRKGFKKWTDTKYWARPLTKNVPPAELYKWVCRYIDLMWPLSRIIHKIPGLGSRLNWKLLIADYRDVFPLPEAMLKEWAILDTFDMLAPTYDSSQFLETVEKWFGKANLVDIDMWTENALIVGRAKTPLLQAESRREFSPSLGRT
jgi:SAM-dependent methyltransferase